MSITLVSALFGDTDEPKSLPRTGAVNSVLFTDARLPLATGWSRVVDPNYPRGDLHPRLRSQYFKHQIHRLDEVKGARWLVWADASIYFIELDFLVAWAEYLERERLNRRALFIPHPQRKTINEEATFVEQQVAAGNEYVLRRYTVEQTWAAIRFLVSRGCPTSAPLYCGGLWMVENSPPYHALLDEWWDCNLRYGNGAIDQLALGGLLARGDFHPHRLEVNLFSNQHFLFVSHP